MSENDEQDQEQQLRKAVRLLEKAVKMLQAADAAIAVKKTQLAVSAAEVAARRAARQLLPEKERQPRVRVMPRERNELIREDGTLRYVNFMKAAGRRPATIGISFRVPGLPRLTTTFTVEGRDFDRVYEVAVTALAMHVGAINDGPLMSAMLATSRPFMKRYGLWPK